MMSRAWERGRLARIAGKDRKANPYGRQRRQNAQWLAGWLHQDERCTPVVVEAEPTLWRCSGSRCPGLPWRASERPHPESCVGPDGR